MAYTADFPAVEPAAVDVAAVRGPLVLEFGVDWCPHCKASQPPLAEALGDFAHVPHWKVEDGKGRPLGRAYRVKLWPTLVFLRDGQEVSRLVRPTSAAPIRDALVGLGAT